MKRRLEINIAVIVHGHVPKNITHEIIVARIASVMKNVIFPVIGLGEAAPVI